MSPAGPSDSDSLTLSCRGYIAPPGAVWLPSCPSSQFQPSIPQPPFPCPPDPASSSSPVGLLLLVPLSESGNLAARAHRSTPIAQRSECHMRQKVNACWMTADGIGEPSTGMNKATHKPVWLLTWLICLAFIPPKDST